MNKTQNIVRDYCSWEPLEISGLPCKRGDSAFVRGDLNGELIPDLERKRFFGVFEYPAKGYEKGYYEVVVKSGKRETVWRKINVKYVFDGDYFSPRWENTDKVNKFFARHYPQYVEREIVYTYTAFGRNIQLLKITDPATALKNKQIIMLTGRMHNPESGMTTLLFRFIKWLLETDRGKQYLKDYLFLILPFTIPLTFEEDPRMHDVNRCWIPEMSEPDLLAIRSKVLDRWVPEIWIELHSFNEVQHLDRPEEKRKRSGDYVVAHPVGEVWFDRPGSRQVAAKAILAAEKAGHEHRNLEFFVEWADSLAHGPYADPGEKIVTEHDPVGIFSAKDYAVYADRCKYGRKGRDWPAMACEYGYYRCHAVNMCFECKPLHVRHEGMVYHYSPDYPNSHLVKLKNICEQGHGAFTGQPVDGFPCNLILADTADNKDSAVLCAWGSDREAMRKSREHLWRKRLEIVVRKRKDENGSTIVAIRKFCSDAVEAAVRLPFPGKAKLPEIRIGNRLCRSAFRKDGFLFIPLKLQPGDNQIIIKP